MAEAVPGKAFSEPSSLPVHAFFDFPPHRNKQYLSIEELFDDRITSMEDTCRRLGIGYVNLLGPRSEIGILQTIEEITKFMQELFDENYGTDHVEFEVRDEDPNNLPTIKENCQSLLVALSLMTKEQIQLAKKLTDEPLKIIFEDLGPDKKNINATYTPTERVININTLERAWWTAFVHQWSHLLHDLFLHKSTESILTDPELLEHLRKEYQRNYYKNNGKPRFPGAMSLDFPTLYASTDLAELFAEMLTALWLNPNRILKNPDIPDHLRQMALFTLARLDKLLPNHGNLLAQLTDMKQYRPSKNLFFKKYYDMSASNYVDLKDPEDMDFREYVPGSYIVYYLLDPNILKNPGAGLLLNINKHSEEEEFLYLCLFVERLLTLDPDNKLNHFIVDALILTIKHNSGQILTEAETQRLNIYELNANIRVSNLKDSSKPGDADPAESIPDGWGITQTDLYLHGVSREEAFLESSELSIPDNILEYFFHDGVFRDEIYRQFTNISAAEIAEMRKYHQPEFDKIIQAGISNRNPLQQAIDEQSLLEPDGLEKRQTLRDTRRIIEELARTSPVMSIENRFAQVGVNLRLAPTFQPNTTNPNPNQITEAKAQTAAKKFMAAYKCLTPQQQKQILAYTKINPNQIKEIQKISNPTKQKPPIAINTTAREAKTLKGVTPK